MAIEDQAKELTRSKAAPGYTVDNGRLVKVE